VNVKSGKLNGLKSHDYHIIMERLLPVMLRGYLDDDVWKAPVELSYFYRQHCAKEIKKRYDREVGERDTSSICKLEKNISSRVVQSDATSSYSYSI
jgi:hypothetical protein